MSVLESIILMWCFCTGVVVAGQSESNSYANDAVMAQELSQPSPAPENIRIIRDHLRNIESKRTGFASVGPVGFHRARVGAYGALMLSLAMKGEWDDSVVSRSWHAILEAEAEIGHSDSLPGLRHAVQACDLLGHDEEAVRWQEQYVRTGEVLQPGDALGYQHLAQLYVRVQKCGEAKDVLHKLVSRPRCLPVDYFYLFGLLSEMGDDDEARQYLARGLDRFRNEAEKARTMFQNTCVLVDPAHCAACEGNPRWQWYVLGSPLLISGDNHQEIRQRLESGFVDITIEAQEYVKRIAESHFQEMRSFAARVTSKPAPKIGDRGGHPLAPACQEEETPPANLALFGQGGLKGLAPSNLGKGDVNELSH